MYQNVFIEKIRGDIFKNNSDIVHLWDDKTGYQTYELENYAYRKDYNGEHETVFGDRVSKVKTWTRWDVEGGKIFESDIYPEIRALVDLYPDSDDMSNGHRLLIFDIEVEVTNGLPDTQKAENVITAISCHDNISDDFLVFILDVDNEIKHVRNDNEEIIPFKSEEELLLAFLQKWEEVNPTIITGWNIDAFDVPYTYHRMINILGEDQANHLSPIRKVQYNKTRNCYFIAGVSSLDYYSLYRKFTFSSRSSYTLDFISKYELGEGKLENPFKNLNEFREKDINGFIEYNLTDTKLVYKIDKKLNFIELVRGICHKGHVPYESIYYSSRWIEGAMLIYLKKLNLIAPNKNPKNKDLMHGVDSYSGGYVKEPILGKHEWLFDLDFTSLYPSIVRTLNISPETKVGKIENWDAEEFLKNKEIDYNGWIEDDKGLIKGNQLAKILKNRDYAISANGVMYRKDKKGIIPQILEEWIKDKDNYDKLMKQYGNKGDKEKSNHYKQRRTIVKTMLNSVYGVLGLPIFRFYDIDNAAAVTTTGVKLIQYTEKMGNHYYNQITNENKDYCIYIDTDSVFFPAKPLVEQQFPDVDTNNVDQMASAILQITSQVQDFLNNSFDMFCDKFLNITEGHNFDVKQEIIGRSGLWIAKKHYVIWVINDSGVKKDEMLFKGMDVVRSSVPEAFKGFLKKLLTSILKSEPRDDIDQYVVDFKNKIRTLTLEEIAKPTSVKNVTKFRTKRNDHSKAFGNWIKGTPAHVKAAISYNEFIDYYNLEKKVVKLSNGEKLKWVYLKDNPFGIDGLAIRGYDDPSQVYDFINKYIDKNKMFEHLLEKKIKDFYGALNWDVPSAEAKIINKFFEF